MSTLTAEELKRLIDLTRLEDSDKNDEGIKALCQSAVTLGPVAAICVYPCFISVVKKYLPQSTIKIATVINFPLGEDNIATIIEDTKWVSQQGADEIDFVFPYRLYLNGEKDEALYRLGACIEAAQGSVFKVILESGQFPNQDLLFEAACEILRYPIQFLKTSTGKTKPGATFPAVNTLLRAIKKTTEQVGIKISGGISEPEIAYEYCDLIIEEMGRTWISPDHVRFGASQLLKKLCGN